MRKVYLLDCTLRDGGYINDWKFGKDTIRGVIHKLSQTGVEFIEVGFIKGDHFNPNSTLFPDVASMTEVIAPKVEGVRYVGMLDMSAPIPMERLTPRTPEGIDGIRVIFKKEKIDEAYQYCKRVQELGYLLFVNFVGTDLYSDQEFISGIEKMDTLHPFSVAIVDSFGLIKRKQFERLVYLADNNLGKDVVLTYHAHNNLQQAYGNAEALVEMNLKRDLCIDACVFGMGRGAGNLNLELFAEFMNENYDTQYRVQPMLEIMDEYLGDIYKEKAWGYSLPLYLSACMGCHPNYAIYLTEKDSLTVKSFREILKSIPKEEKAKFSKDKAEKYYRAYQENYIDDRSAIIALTEKLEGKRVLILAPGSSLLECTEEIRGEMNKPDTVTIATSFTGGEFRPNYIFCSNMRRYRKIQGKTDIPCITTSNMKECTSTDYVINFSSYASDSAEILDNSGLMAIRLAISLGVRKILLAGMDGYSTTKHDYVYRELEFDFSAKKSRRNQLISQELGELAKQIELVSITPTSYIF